MRRACLAVLGVIFSAPVAWAVTVTDQFRAVQTNAIALLDGTTDTQFGGDTAPDAGPFVGSAVTSASVVSGALTYLVTSSASQNSSLSATQFSFSGELSLEGALSGTGTPLSIGADASATSNASIVFHVDGPTTLTPVMQLNNTLPSAVLDFFASLHQGGAEIVVWGPNASVPSPFELAPGDYALSMNATISRVHTASALALESASYTVEANFSPSGNPIPLPPAVWPGIATLAMASAGTLRGRMRSRD